LILNFSKYIKSVILNNKNIKSVSFNSLLIFCTVYLYSETVFSQQIHTSKNSPTQSGESNVSNLDSLKPVISGIVISGNGTTQDEIILREMKLAPGQVFSSEQCRQDEQSIYNLGLFANVEMLPELQADNKVLMNIKVQEKWYIYPSPQVDLTDGDIKKITVGLSVHWQNFRGRNENVSAGFGLGYNPFVRASYTVPWIGEKVHLFITFSGGYSRDNNRSLLALGRINGNQITYRNDTNFNYINYNLKLTLGKYFTKQFSVYTEAGYSFLRVSQYADNRTLSPDGVDKYMLLGLGTKYDGRNSREYTTEGYYVNANYEHFGLLSKIVNFGRLNLETREYIPVDITPDYSVTFASRFYTSVAVGSLIPYYNHKFLGYGSDFVRGWSGLGYEGDNDITLYNEIRIPLIQPNYIKGEQIPIVKMLPYLKTFSYKYGLYFTMFYDFGGIWNKDDKFRNIQFLNGTGVGLNAILPFGLIGTVEWGFRLGKPTVGQIMFGAGAKF
jgi:outer membrane protein assembly factor BamA